MWTDILLQNQTEADTTTLLIYFNIAKVLPHL